VSHDRYFIDAVADTIWMVKDGGIEAFYGTYSEYAAYLEAKERKLIVDERQAKETRKPGEKQAAGNRQQSESLGTGNGHVVTNGNGSAQASSSNPQVVDKDQNKEQRKRQRKLAALEEEIAMLEAELKQLGE